MESHMSAKECTELLERNEQWQQHKNSIQLKAIARLVRASSPYTLAFVTTLSRGRERWERKRNKKTMLTLQVFHKSPFR